MDRYYGCDRFIYKDYSFFRSIVCFPLKGEKCSSEALVTEILWNLKHWCSSREKCIFFYISWNKEVQKSLWTFTNLFTVALVCTNGKNTRAGIKVSGLGRFPTKELCNCQKKNTDWGKHIMGEWVDQKDVSRISTEGLWEQTLLLLQNDCKLWGCG